MVGEDQSTDGLTSDKIYGLDLADNGKLTFQLDSEATKNAVIERTGIDMDEGGSGASNYLVVTRIFPQVDTTNQTDTTMSFEFGASDILEMSRPTPLQSPSTQPQITRSTVAQRVDTSHTRSQSATTETSVSQAST